MTLKAAIKLDKNEIKAVNLTHRLMCDLNEIVNARDATFDFDQEIVRINTHKAIEGLNNVMWELIGEAWFDCTDSVNEEEG